MNILVCVKQVPDDVVKVELNAENLPDTEPIDKIVNSFDTYAVELAVLYVEANGGKVTVASIGDEKGVRPAVVQMIAVGAGGGYIAKGAPEAADNAALAGNLAELVKKIEEAEGEPFDLILCGKESTDEISAQVGAMLAEKLGVSFVSDAMEFEAADCGLKVKQETDDGFAFYEVAAPAVLTVGKTAFEPRYPSLKSKMAARKAKIPFVDDLAESEAAVSLCAYLEPPKREAGIKIQEKEAADSVAKAFEVMAQDKAI